MFPHQTHIPHAPSRLNPSFPNPSLINGTTALPTTVPFPSPPAVVGGGRFGKRKLSIQSGRGTMSMPTSPLRQSGNAEPAREGPHSASALLSQPTATSQSRLNTTQIPSFFSDRTISPPDNDYHEDQNSDQLRYDYEGRDEYEQDERRGEGDDVPPPRKKRAQVRVACTHCQKACKKCSNTRPCERCVKYGLPDCIDSMRKPRKTGVKRGPYKRRTSSLYQQIDQYPSQPHQSYSQVQPTYVQQQQHQRQHQGPDLHTQQQTLMPPHQVPGASTITQAFAAAFSKPTWINGRRQSIISPSSLPQSHPQAHVFASSNTSTQYGYAAPPPPAAIAFQNTFLPNSHSHHLNSNHNQKDGNGHMQRQRIPSISTHHIDHLPQTQAQNKADERRGSMSSIFPISLNSMSGQDPFSRTVSPIGHKFVLPNSNLSTTDTITMDMDMDVDHDQQDIDMDQNYSMSITPPMNVNVVDFAYPTQISVYHSAPTSPRGTRMENDHLNAGRASSAELPSSSTFTSTFGFQNPNLNPNPPLPHFQPPPPRDQDISTGIKTPLPAAIRNDRRPSLFTLMNTRPITPSTLNNTQAQLLHPHVQQGGTESPTLFDGLPPPLDHTFNANGERERERRMSFFGSMSMGMSLPNAGGVGRLSLSKGSEGLGLGLGLEHVS